MPARSRTWAEAVPIGLSYWVTLVVGRLQRQTKGTHSSKFLPGDDRKVGDDSSGYDIRYFLARCWDKNGIDDITLQTKIRKQKTDVQFSHEKWWWYKRHRIWALPCLSLWRTEPTTPPTSFGVILPQTLSFFILHTGLQKPRAHSFISVSACGSLCLCSTQICVAGFLCARHWGFKPSFPLYQM